MTAGRNARPALQDVPFRCREPGSVYGSVSITLCLQSCQNLSLGVAKVMTTP
jgi:hypothetical protein